MLKHFAIVGLLLFLAGGGALLWTMGQARMEVLAHHADPNAGAHMTIDPCMGLEDGLVQLHEKSPQQLQADQEARLKADIDEMAAADSLKDPALGRILYGENWQEEVRHYRERLERDQFIETGLIVVTWAGGLLLGWCLLWGISKLILKVARSVWGLVRPARPDEASSKQTQKPQSSQRPQLNVGRERISVQHSVTAETGPGRRKMGMDDIMTAPPKQAQAPDEPEGLSDYDQDMDTLLSDEGVDQGLPPEPSAAPVAAMTPLRSEPVKNSVLQVQPEDPPTALAVLDPTEEITQWENSLTEQAADLERQMAQVQAIAQRVNAQGTGESVNRTLQQLSEQISAIREYAAGQQERVEKLQSGYDWNIIRSFCIRVIRCVDNLEVRISQLKETGQDTTAMDQVREELLFALESSGVEQFEPELHAIFSGQQRWAEAVKDKEPCLDARLSGSIARVLRPGYHYVMDEENTKIVRTARVMLFE